MFFFVVLFSPHISSLSIRPFPFEFPNACWEKMENEEPYTQKKTKHVFSVSSVASGRGKKKKSHKRVSILMILISAFYDPCPWLYDGKKILLAAIWFREIGRSGQSHLAAIETSGGGGAFRP